MTQRLATLLAFVPALAIAHPGHGHTAPESWTHYLTEPLHAGVLAGAAVASVVLVRLWRARRRRINGSTS